MERCTLAPLHPAFRFMSVACWWRQRHTALATVISMQHTHVEEVARRIQVDFAQTPGLHVTFWQAQRLWHLSDDVCDGR